jgi:hypothetical protein
VDKTSKPVLTFMDIMFESYEKTIKVSQLYKLAGNFPLSEKYRQDAEKIYAELQKFEDSLEIKWEKLQAIERGRHAAPGPIWNQTFWGRRTLPTSGLFEGGYALQKKSNGGRKTRKNKGK